LTTTPLYPSYEAVCDELDRRRRIDLGFERIEALLKLLGDPHRSLEIVQVVGTNGKGTTAVALASALEAAGETAGAYLSPHVLSYTERVMLRGRYACEEEFAAAMRKTVQIADANEIPATQFELLTAGALALFRDAELKWTVLEAGLGARHDATSAAEPEAVVLTNVGLDHTEYLGDTIEEIAGEKLASLRRGAVLILGTDDPRVVSLARETVAGVGASLVEHREPEEHGQTAPGAEKNSTPHSGGPPSMRPSWSATSGSGCGRRRCYWDGLCGRKSGTRRWRRPEPCARGHASRYTRSTGCRLWWTGDTTRRG
jgi:dihydrofolate synthase/folylpolyglutamate synthase